MPHARESQKANGSAGRSRRGWRDENHFDPPGSALGRLAAAQCEKLAAFFFYRENAMEMNETGARWLRQNGACTEGREWALAECATLGEVWATARPDWLIWVATRDGVLDDRTLGLFACWRAEQALPHRVAAYPDDRRPQIAIETRRRWIDGDATDEELAAARAAARAAQAKWLRDNATPVFPDAQTSTDLTTPPKTIISGEVSPTDAAAALPRGEGSSGEDGDL